MLVLSIALNNLVLSGTCQGEWGLSLGLVDLLLLLLLLLVLRHCMALWDLLLRKRMLQKRCWITGDGQKRQVLRLLLLIGRVIL